MADIDRVLRESLGRLAEPGDPTGVAEAVRARVDAGDPGLAADGGPGFSAGGFGAGGGGWPVWMGVAVVAALGGAALGAFGVFDARADAGDAPTPVVSMAQTTPGLDCPDGAPVVRFHPGDRVLAVARSDDGAWLAVRSPVDRADTVWVALDGVVIDDGQAPVDALSVDGCAAPALVLAEPAPEPEPEVTEEPDEPDPQEPESPRPTTRPEPSRSPEPPSPSPSTPPARPTPSSPPSSPPPSSPPPSSPPPSPTPDTTPPKVTKVSLSSTEAACAPGFSKPTTVKVTVTATDDDAVDRVTLRASGADTGGPWTMTRAGSAWEYVYDPDDSTFGTVTLTAQAFDRAGNASATKSATVDVDCLR